MKILSIGQKIEESRLEIVNIALSEIEQIVTLEEYDYLLVSGGDGAIRRIIKTLHHKAISIPPLILNPTGSFNVIAKLHRVPKLETILHTLTQGQTPQTNKQAYYALNDEVFLFSAGNMGDLQHIFLSETLRFGILKYGSAKYVLALLFLLPLHIIMTPFMLFSKRRFFIFTPASFISKFGSFYGKVTEEIEIDLDNGYNHIELDGDVVTLKSNTLKIVFAGEIHILAMNIQLSNI